ncbi:hypothetical protein BDR22DRAFT_920742 [Usnea florida]
MYRFPSTAPFTAKSRCLPMCSSPLLTDNLDSRRRREESTRFRSGAWNEVQHRSKAQRGEIAENEQNTDQVPSNLPIHSTVEAKYKQSQIPTFSKNKQDKRFVNKLLKDKGLYSHDWRIAFNELQKHYTPEKVDSSKSADTVGDARNLIQSAGSHIQILGSSDVIQSRARDVVSISRNHRTFQLAHKIPPPTKWSEANLRLYIEALAESQRTEADVIWAEKPQVKRWSNIGDVVAAFDNVFYGTTSQESLSIEACNTALRFFYDHSMMAKARSLYIRMEDLKMPIPTETFNILLRGSASQRDLHSFTFLLKNMARRGFKPNDETWTLFLQVIDNSEVRAVIVRKMEEMNMLNKIGVRRAVAAQMVTYEISNFLADGRDHHDFLRHMNSKYRPGWLSTAAGNKLLDEVAKRKSVGESLTLLYEMKEAGFMPDDISINTLLRHCLPLRLHGLAIEILEAFEYHYQLYPRHASHETLFLQAWRSRLLNFSAVIWRSACIYNAVSDKMRHLVFQSLLSYAPTLDENIQSSEVAKPSNLSLNARFKKFAGMSAVGVDGPRGAEIYQAMNTLNLEPQKRTLKWAQVLIESNLRISRTCALKQDLSQLLRQALTMDKTWAAERSYKYDDWRKMLLHVIVVEVEILRRQGEHPQPHRNVTSESRDSRLLTQTNRFTTNLQLWKPTPIEHK